MVHARGHVKYMLPLLADVKKHLNRSDHINYAYTIIDPPCFRRKDTPHPQSSHEMNHSRFSKLKKNGRTNFNIDASMVLVSPSAPIEAAQVVARQTKIREGETTALVHSIRYSAHGLDIAPLHANLQSFPALKIVLVQNIASFPSPER